LIGFSSLTKLLLSLLSKDYYKLISIVAVLMNRIVFVFNAISRNQRGMKHMERVYRVVSH